MENIPSSSMIGFPLCFIEVIVLSLSCIQIFILSSRIFENFEKIIHSTRFLLVLLSANQNVTFQNPNVTLDNFYKTLISHRDESRYSLYCPAEKIKITSLSDHLSARHIILAIRQQKIRERDCTEV